MLTLLVSTNACNRNLRSFWFTNLDPNRINSGMKLLFDAPKLIAHSKNSWNSGSATKVGILSWRRFLMNSKSMVFELSALLCNAHSPDNTDKAVNSVVRKAIELLSFNAFEMRAQAPGSSTTIFQCKTSTNKPPPASVAQFLEVLNRSCGLHVQSPICARCHDLALLFGEFPLSTVQPI